MSDRVVGKPFKKGQSGNPSGRPKVVGEVRDLAREHTTDAIKTLVTICKNTKAPPAARVTAASALLDRGYGRPAQSVDVTHRREVVDLTDAELTDIASRSGNGAAEQTNGKAKSHSVH